MDTIRLTPVQTEIAAQFLISEEAAGAALDGDLLLLPDGSAPRAVERLETALRSVRIPDNRSSGEASQAFTRYWAIRRLRHKLLQHCRRGVPRNASPRALDVGVA